MGILNETYSKSYIVPGILEGVLNYVNDTDKEGSIGMAFNNDVYLDNNFD